MHFSNQQYFIIKNNYVNTLLYFFFNLLSKLYSMAENGSIIIVDKDLHHRSFLEDVFRDLKVNNKIVYCTNAESALEYLLNTKDGIFLIFSDIKLPTISGLEMKRIIDDNPELRKKSIPFIFYTSTVNQNQVNEAYIEMTIQGFFQKDMDYNEAREEMKGILYYWNRCRHPDKM